jgi:asparagine synthase (glutamine-hydrolysing)
MITKRQDKMGFPTPFADWIKSDARDFVMDVFSSQKAQTRELIDNGKVIRKMGQEKKFSRNIWGLFCLELWQQEFHDKEASYKKLLA